MSLLTKFLWQKRLLKYSAYFFIGKTVYMCCTDLVFLLALDSELTSFQDSLEQKTIQDYKETLTK